MGAELSIQIVSLMITRQKFSDFEKSLAFVLNSRKDFISHNNSNREEITIDILRNLSIDNYQRFLKSMEQVTPQTTLPETRILPETRAEPKPESVSESLKVIDQPEYSQLIREKEELKIRNKNQEEEIHRLKNQITTLKSSKVAEDQNEVNRCSGYDEIDDDEDYEFYYEEEEYIDGY